MNAARCYLRWIIIGMGNVMGISQSMPNPAAQSSSVMDAIGGDFAAAGSDIWTVIQRYPASNPETPKALGHKAKQLELAGLG